MNIKVIVINILMDVCIKLEIYVYDVINNMLEFLIHVLKTVAYLNYDLIYYIIYTIIYTIYYILFIYYYKYHHVYIISYFILYYHYISYFRSDHPPILFITRILI